MAEASPGKSKEKELRLKLKLEFLPKQTDVKNRSIHSSEKNIKTVRDSAISLFSKNDNLQNCIQKIKYVRSIRVENILQEGNLGISFECLLNTDEELNALKNAARNETVKACIVQIVEKEIPLFTWYKLRLCTTIVEDEPESKRKISKPFTGHRTEQVFIKTEEEKMKQTMAQTHVEPLLVSLHAAYLPQILETAHDISAVNQILVKKLQNIESVNDHFRDKNEFKGCRIQEMEVLPTKEKTVIIRIAIFNGDEVDSLVTAVNSGRLGQELESYISASVSGIKNIKFSININASEIEHCRNVLLTRTRKPFSWEKPPLKPKPAGEETSKKSANVYAIVSKTFCVFVPSDQIKNVHSVKIETLRSPKAISEQIDNKNLSEHRKIKRLWTIRVSMPVNMKLNLNYKYCVTGTTSNVRFSLGSSFGQFSSETEEIHEQQYRTCSDIRTERDVFNDSGPTVDGLLGHFQHILDDADDTNINESFDEINRFTEAEKLPIDQKEKIIQALTKGCTLTSLKSLCIFGMLNVLKISDQKCGLDDNVCKSLMIQISGSRIDDMENSMKKSILKVVLGICSSIRESSFVHFITYVYPFFDEEMLLDIFTYREKYNLKESSDYIWNPIHQSTWECRVLDCVNIICNRAKHERIPKCMVLLEKFLSCLPARQTMMCINQVLVEFKEHPEFSQDIENLLSTMEDKYENHLSEIAQKGDSKGIEDIWREMDTRSRKCFLKKVEDSLLLCFDEKFVKPRSFANTCMTVQSMCKHYDKLFREEKQQIRLFNMLYRSPYDSCHDLFQQLIEMPGFCEKTLQSSCAHVTGWYESVLNKIKESRGPDGSRIQKIYSKLGSVMENSEIIQINKQLQDNLSGMTYSFMLNDIDIEQAFSMIGHVWSSKKAEEWFINHLGQIIRTQHGAGKKLVKKLFKEKRENFEVNKSAMAKLIVILMEDEGSACTSLNLDDAVSHMVNNANFWMSTMNVQGRKKNIVKNSDIFGLTLTRLSEFKEQLSQKRYNKRTFDLFRDKEHDLFRMYEIIVPSSEKLEALWKSCRSQFDDNLNMLFDMVKYVNEIKGLQEFAGDRFSETCSVVGQCIENKIKALSDGSIDLVAVLEIDVFGKSHDPNFHQMCAWLSPFVKSRVFKNINRDILTSFLSVRSKIVGYMHGEERNEDFHIRLLHAFVGYLFTEGQQRYKILWTPFVEGNDIEVKTVLKNFRSAIGEHEIKLAETKLKKILNNDMKTTLLNLLVYKDYKPKLCHIKNALDLFEIDQDHHSEFMRYFEIFLRISDQTMFQVNTVLKYLYAIADEVDIDMLSILSVLRKTEKSIELIHFLRREIDVDMSNLVDSVEDYSEQNVSLSTVSSLIEVQSFLKPLLQFEHPNDIPKFLSIFKDALQSNRTEQIDSKFNDCLENVFGIKFLYDNMANREEKTREIINNIIEQGSFHFTLKDGFCTFNITYSLQKTKVTHSASKLNDLKSQALLIMNTEKKNRLMQLRKQIQSCNFQHFITVVDQAFGIYELCTDLYLSGHDQYQCFQEKANCTNLYNILKKLHLDYKEWEATLKEIRELYPYMNYVYGLQIHKLYNFFVLLTPDINVLHILQFISPSVSIKEMQAIIKAESSKKRSTIPIKAQALRFIAEKIKQVCELAQPVIIPFPIERKNFKIKDCVHKGRMYVAQLQTGSDLVTKVMMSLYLNTTSKVPSGNQVLFCNKNTKWVELYLLLQRCENENKNRRNSLFCIAYVEFLSTDVRTQLALELQNMEKNPNILLALIIRCDSDNPFLNCFTENVMNPESLSEPQVRECLQSLCESVKVFTSDSAGLGKTEAIKEEAYCRRQRLVSFHISGPFCRKSVIHRMLSLNLKKTDCLHIDIGQTNDAVELDLFLFQLLFVKIVSAGTTMCSLQTEYVCIELANALNGSLERDMPHIALFKRKHLSWKGFSNYKISSEITSNVQVVCQYLQRFEKNELDQVDIYFSGPKKIQALKPNICRNLLANCFEAYSGLTFPQINIFISVLAQQLKRLSMSTFFRTKTLGSGILPPNTDIRVKSTLVSALIEISKTFALKSIQAARKSQMMTIRSLAEMDRSRDKLSEMYFTNDVQGIIKWEDSNHLILLFQNKDKETISALYKDLQCVPDYITKLLEIQGQKQLQDLNDMHPTEQQNLVFGIARSGNRPMETQLKEALAKSYVLTTDNILKMTLIWLRIQAKIPVIVMGDTGCGKTSLLMYLSKICGSSLELFNVHAGIDDKIIIDRVQEINSKALRNIKNPIWIFFDEINTTDSIGLLSDILCHRKVNGQELAPNLILLAACNPYKLRNKYSMKTPGLQGKLKSDKLSHLVYRVHPLPEALIEYIWDFGSLSTKDEREYIKRIVQINDKILPNPSEKDLFVILISESQCFVRNEEKSSYSVSLRDVNRCQKLYQWFMCTYFELKNSNCYSNAQSVKAMILSLAHCYYCRFQFSEVRQRYLEKISYTFRQNGSDFSEEFIKDTIKKEQCYILEKMELPAGTAKNTALQENVFMILVSALNKLPLFIVGKPGCSKSLSIQLIKSNLRGKDSKNYFFAELPRVMCVAFQGSESSTSDGIIKVFERANGIGSNESVLPLVILDEIGLAELSQFNPLKVLHSLLESVDRDTLDVAVVGISNWSLDAAKMNRAIHLCRPDMDYSDVYKTGLSIVKSFNDHETDIDIQESVIPRTVLSDLKEKCLEAIAGGYTEYIQRQSFENFHGLRDFYSLIKYLSRNWFCKNDVSSVVIPDIINQGLCRNFGGKKTDLDLAKQIFKDKIQDCLDMNEKQSIPVYELIKSNVMDTNCRHLMLLSNGDAIINILTQLLDDIGREHVTIVGSKFEDDQTDDYNYRNLSQIILCMEQGKVLILKDLDNIYGSLYDMLNQNYTEFAKKRYCRVALGEYSNPLCYVKDEFKCIVLVEESDLDKSDPPFLNRFEKQQFSYADLLPKHFSGLETNLESICVQICNREKIYQSAFLKNCVPISGDDMLKSLLLLQANECTDLSSEDLEESCLLKLLYLCTPESLMKLNESELSESDKLRIRKILSQFLKLPVHNGLSFYLEHFNSRKSCELPLVKQQKTIDAESFGVNTDFENKDNMVKNLTNISLQTSVGELNNMIGTSTPDQKCKIPGLQIFPGNMSEKLIVFTHSNIHCNIQSDLDRAEVVRISRFKSKKSIESVIDDFMLNVLDKYYLVIQFDMRFDFKHLLLVKTIIDTNLNQLYMKDSTSRGKTIIIVLHLTRNTEEEVDLGRKLNFLSGWNFVYLDTLEKPKTSLTELIGKNIHEIILASKEELPLKIQKKLVWALTRMNYTMFKLRKVQDLNSIVETIQNTPELLELFAHRICKWTPTDMATSLVPVIASDSHALYLSFSLIGAISSTIDDSIGNQVAKMIFVLEELGAFDCLLSTNTTETIWKIWKKIFENENIFNIDNVPDPEGPCCYIVQRTVNGFKTPFFSYFFQQIESLKQDFLSTAKRCFDDLEIDTVDELTASELNNLTSIFKVKILSKITELTRSKIDSQRNDYIEDFLLHISGLYSCRLDKKKKLAVIQWIMSKYCRIPETFDETVVVLHTTFWLFHIHIMALTRLIDVAVNEFSVSLSSLLYETPANDTNDGEAAKGCGENIVSVFAPLIEYIFRVNIPSSHVLKILSISIWQRKVNGLFCLSNVLGVDDPVEHILRFCHDLTVTVLIPYSLDRSILQVIGDALSFDHSRLETSSTFETILKTLRDVREKHQHVPMEALQRTVCMYINRCFAADSNQNSDQATLLTIMMLRKNLEDGDFDTKLTGVGPTLGLALRNLYFLNSSLFLQLFSCTDLHLENYGLLRIINQCLASKTIGKMLEGIVCYLLQRDIYSKLMENHDHIAKDEAITLLTKASDVIYSDNGMDFKKVAALSFCRAYISKFVDSKDFLNIKKYKNVWEAVNTVLNRHKSNHSNGIVLYFLNCIENGNGVYHLRCTCKSLSDAIDTCQYYTSANTDSDIDIYPLVPHVSDIFKEFKKELKDTDQEDVAEIFSKFTSNRDVCLCSLTFLQSNHLRKVSPNISVDINRVMVRKALKVAEIALTEFQSEDAIPFIKYLAGETDLSISALDLHFMDDNFHLTSVISQFICLVISHCSENNIWKQLICNPCKVLGTGIPFEKRILHIKTYTMATTCNNCCHRILSEFNECPVCEKGIGIKQMHQEGKNEDGEDSGFFCMLIDFLICSCLLTALGISKNETDHNTKSKSIQKSMDIPEQSIDLFLENRIESHWNRLKVFVATENAGLCRIFQLIFIDTLHLFKNDCRMLHKDDWGHFKTEFSSDISRIIGNQTKCMHNLWLKFQKAFSMHLEDCLEIQLKYPDVLMKEGITKSQDRAMCLRYLNPSPENLLVSMYAKSVDRRLPLDRNLPLLRVVLENLEWIRLPKFLPSIVSWHSTFVQCARFRLKKSDLQSMTISQFIDSLSGEQNQLLSSRFTDLKETLDGFKHLTSNLEDFTEHITLLDKLGDDPLLKDLVILRGSSLMYMITETLAMIQNKFLEKVLEISCMPCMDGYYGCPDISFVLKGSHAAAIQTKDLMNVARKDVITFDFDRILKYSQCGTSMHDYSTVHYDYVTTQLEIAYMLHSKVFIIIPKYIPFLEFVDDLYRNSTLMLESIKDMCDQRPLQEKTERYLKKICDDNPSICLNLFTITGILLAAVTQSSEINSKIPLPDFIDEWKNSFPEGSMCDVLLSVECQLHLCNLVPLYKFLEETNGNLLINSISQYYKVGIGEDDRTYITSQSQNNFYMMRHLFKAMKILLHRCPFLRQSFPESKRSGRQQRICDLLDDTSLWCDGCEHCRTDENYYKNCIKCIPEKLTMKQFYSTMVFIKEKVKRNIKPETPTYTTDIFTKRTRSRKKKKLDDMIKMGDEQNMLVH